MVVIFYNPTSSRKRYRHWK